MIRMAKKEDAKAVSQLLTIIFQDMELPILETLGEERVQELVAEAVLNPEYRFGYTRGLVCELDEEVAGVAFGYPDEDEAVIDQPLDNVMKKAGIQQDVQLFIDSEVFPDEWYLDTIVVNPKYQGRGVGTKLIKQLPEFAKKNHKKKIGLNVDLTNPKAKKLYERLGFKKVGEIEISQHLYEHMQKDI